MSTLTRQYIFFDIDSLELVTDTQTASVIPHLGVRQRMLPWKAQLNTIHQLAIDLQAVQVFCTCCSGTATTQENCPEALHIPVDKQDQSWRDDLWNARLIHLMKRSCGIPSENFTRRYFDMFLHNENGYDLIHMLPTKTWVVYGNGFDLCVCAAIDGLLAQERSVIILTDILCSSAEGYGPFGTESFREKKLADYKARGVGLMTLNTFKSALVYADML